MVDFNQKRLQLDRFILFYSVPVNNDLNYNLFLKTLVRRKGVGFSFYSSEFSLDELLNNSRVSAVASNRVYYYLSVSYTKRQNIYVDKVINSVITPNYLAMTCNNEGINPILCYPNYRYAANNVFGIDRLEKIFASNDGRVKCLEDEPIRNIESLPISNVSLNEDQFLYDSFMDTIVNYESKKQVFDFISKPENKSLMFRADEILNKFNAILEFRNATLEKDKPVLQLSNEDFSVQEQEPVSEPLNEDFSVQEQEPISDPEIVTSSQKNLFSPEQTRSSQKEIDNILKTVLKSPDPKKALENSLFMNSLFLPENKDYIISILQSLGTTTNDVRNYTPLHKTLYNYFIKKNNFSPSRKSRFQSFLPLIYSFLPLPIQDELKDLM